MNLTAIAALCAGLLALNLYATPAQAADPPPFSLEVSAGPPWPLADAAPLAAPATPPPAAGPPVVVIQQPAQQFQTTATSWIYSLVAVLGVVTTVLLPAFAVLWSKVQDLVKRQDRQAQKTGSLQQQVTSVALAATPAAAAPPTTSPIVPAILALLMPATLLLGGCATASSPQEAAERRALARQAASTGLRLAEAGATAYLESREGFRK